MMQPSFIYLVSLLLFGISLLYNTNSVQAGLSGRLPFLNTASKSMISLKTLLGFPNTVLVNNISAETRTILLPVLVEISSLFYPLSPTLADTMVNGNVADENLLTLSPSVSSSAYQCISSSAFLLTTDDYIIFAEGTLLSLGYIALSYVIAKLLADFSSHGFRSFETSMVKLQIGLDAQNWSDSDAKDMDKIMSDMFMYKSLRSSFMSEATVKLLGKQDDWHSASLECRRFFRFSSAEFDYHRLSLVERSKLQAGSVGGRGASSNSLLVGDIPQRVGQQQRQWWLEKLLTGGSGYTASSSISSTTTTAASSSFSSETKLVVVTLVVLLRGRSVTNRSSGSVLTAAEVRESLLALTSEAQMDSGRHLEQAEFLCFPRALSEEDTLLLYPELWRL